MYVTLEPCPMCAGAIVQARIPKVVFGCRNPKAGSAGSVLDLLHVEGLNHQVSVEEGILGEECAETMRVFFSGVEKKEKGSTGLTSFALHSILKLCTAGEMAVPCTCNPPQQG